VRDGAQPSAFLEAERRPSVTLHELIETIQPVLHCVEARSRPAKGARHHERVPGPSPRPAGNALASPDGCHADAEFPRCCHIPAENGHASFGDALVQLEDRGVSGLGRDCQPDEQPDGLGGHSSEIAEIDRGGLVAEVAPGSPLHLEMDALDEHVLRDHEVALENGAFGVLAGREPPALELPEEPELTQF